MDTHRFMILFEAGEDTILSATLVCGNTLDCLQKAVQMLLLTADSSIDRITVTRLNSSRQQED